MDAIMFVAEPLTVTPDAFAVLCKFAYKHKIPIGGAMMMVGEYHSMFGLNAEFFVCGQEVAPSLDKILKGTEAGTIPIVSSEMFLEIHTGATDLLGVTVPEGLLQQAKKVHR